MDCTSSEQQLIFCMPTYLSCQKAILDLTLAEKFVLIWSLNSFKDI